MVGWLKRQYNDIKGHLKYELLKLALGSTVISAAGVFISKLPHWPDWYQFGAIFVVSLVALLLLRGRISVPEKSGPPAPLKQSSLQEKARALGSDLFAFLREKGPEPNPQFDASVPFDDRLREVIKLNHPYIEHVYRGYEHRYKKRVIDLVHELAEHDVEIPELSGVDLNLPQSADSIRTIAKSLYLTGARIDAGEAAKGT